MAIREVYAARQELELAEGRLRALTGVYRTRIEHAKVRLAKATEQQRRMQEEYDRLIYTLRAGFGVSLGQQTLASEPAPSEPRLTFIQKTSATELRRRIRDLHRRLNEAPG
ncbi:MAG TPA: hypothetical protein VMG99_08690 [Thermoplasmata archaeon]|nr:hypothetical protein [Thermoplasmata archaeon]